MRSNVRPITLTEGVIMCLIAVAVLIVTGSY